MRQVADRGGGAIVNQSSTAAWLYSNFYGLAKVGINGLTQQLATELQTQQKELQQTNEELAQKAQ